MASLPGEPSRIQVIKGELVLEEEEQQRRRRRSSGLEAIICFSSGHGNQVLARLVQRLNEELDEATSMRQDAEASHETEIAAECKAAEDDLRRLVSELSAELERLQKPSGGEAVRARLQKLRASGARARSVLSSRELGSGDLANVDVHHARESPLEAAGPPTASGPGLAGPLLPPIAPTSKPASLKEGQMGAAMSPKSSRGLPDIGSPLSTSAGSTKPLTSTSGPGNGSLSTSIPSAQQARHVDTLPIKPVASSRGPRQNTSLSPASASPREAGRSVPQPKAVEFGGLGGFSSPSSGASGMVPRFGPSAASNLFASGPPADLARSDQSGSESLGGKFSEASLENHARSSHASLDSFADSAFGGPSSIVSIPTKSSPSSPKPVEPSDFGFGESAFRPAGGLDKVTEAPAESFGGFGESAFGSPAIPAVTNETPHASQPGLDQGPNISLRDSFPVSQVSRPAGALEQGGGWQAFNISPSTAEPNPINKQSSNVSWDAEPAQASSQDMSLGLGSNGALASSFPPAVMPTQAAPSPSVRSGNPFQDFDAEPDTSNTQGTFSGLQGNNLRSPQGGTDGMMDSFSRLGNSAPTSGFPAPSVGTASLDNPFHLGESATFPSFPTPPAAPHSVPQAQEGFDPFGGQTSGFGGSPSPFSSAFGAASVEPSSVPILPGNHAVPQRGPQPGADLFGSATDFSPQASNGQFKVTPSMVIPEADWEAAFASPAAVTTPVTASEVPQAAENPIIPSLQTTDEDSLWIPMTAHDRSRCEEAFRSKYGGQEVSLSSARELHSRAGIDEPLDNIFSLTDLDGNGKLSFAEFLLFMYLLKQMRKGVTLPKQLTYERISYLLGSDLASLGSMFSLEPAPSPVPDRVSYEKTKSTQTTALETLMTRGASEERAKRALFLNGDDLETAQKWLDQNKETATAARFSPGHLTTKDGPAKASSFEGATGPKVSIKFEKALLVYKKTLDRPVFHVSLRDAWGDAIGEVIETPSCTYENGIFQAGHSAILECPVERMPEGAVVYFELRHWKAKEKKWSTLGWTYMHKEGFIKLVDGIPKVRTEAQGLHLYEKPLDFRSHFRQASMRKMKPLAEVPDLFLRFSEV